jgi:hypothetical protein
MTNAERGALVALVTDEHIFALTTGRLVAPLTVERVLTVRRSKPDDLELERKLLLFDDQPENNSL